MTPSPASPPVRRRWLLADVYSTAIGKKYAMAVSGIALMGFVLFHMLGNLKMYASAASLDHYAHFLHTLLYPIAPKGAVLWVLRAFLASMLLLHVHAAWSLTVLNRKARPVKYQSAREYQQASIASRSMRLTGLVVLAFVVWHLLDLTFGVVNPAVGELVLHPGDTEAVKAVHASVVASFSRPLVAVFYVVANSLLGVHLYHGASSVFVTLGTRPQLARLARPFALGFALLVTAGNVSFPLAVITGIVR